MITLGIIILCLLWSSIILGVIIGYKEYLCKSEYLYLIVLQIMGILIIVFSFIGGYIWV